MYKNTPYVLRALVLGTLLAATGLGFASANTTTSTTLRRVLRKTM